MIIQVKFINEIDKVINFKSQRGIKNVVIFFIFPVLGMGILALLQQIGVPIGQYVGIRPRTPRGLIGIPCAPYAHFGIFHWISNMGGFIGLGTALLTNGMMHFFMCTVICQIIPGTLVWIFGRSNSVHAGLSGMVFGYFGFLLSYGLLLRPINWHTLGIVFFVIGVYGSLLFSFFSIQPGISWESHLFGFVTGIVWGLLAARCIYIDKSYDNITASSVSYDTI
eukprot:GHVL01012470.1.p1 GENE.GHVL01012470.1~~GHVL01012470.1.p1  ORF type:complete len:223 (+),score=22.25 GHVL01012470.1:140-808(+)